jgi:hypothetical protein
MTAPLILATDGTYVVAAHVEYFYHVDDDTTCLYATIRNGDSFCVIEDTNPQKEAQLFRNIGYQIVTADSPAPEGH